MRFLSSSQLGTETVEGFQLKLESENVDYLQPKDFSKKAAPVTQLSDVRECNVDAVTQHALDQFSSVAHCLDRGPAKDVRRIVELLLDAEIAQEKVVTCLERYPELMLLSVEEVQLRIDAFLEMGMMRTAVFEMVIACPEVIGFDFERDVRPVFAFFAGFLGSQAAAVDLLSHSPIVLTYSLEQDIQPKIKFLESLGCGEDDIASLIRSYPSILCLSIKQSMQAKIDYLLSRLPNMNVKQAIMAFPGFLDMSLETHVKTKMEFFLDVLEVDSKKFSKYLPHFPQIFSCEIEENIKRKIEFVCLKMDIVEGKRKRMRIVKQRSLVFMSCPSLFGFSAARLLERIEQIRSLTFRNDTVLDALFVQCPLLFGCTVDVEDVERVVRSLMDALTANRLHFLQILKTNPDILLSDPDDIDAFLDSEPDTPPTDLVVILSNKSKLQKALRPLIPSKTSQD